MTVLKFKQKLKAALSARPAKLIADRDLLKAGVLVPISIRDNECLIHFTRRSHSVKWHKGEMSFPGGGCEQEDETPLDTALRESHEEIGLKPEDVEILGRLDDVITRYSNFIVSPFIAFIPSNYEFVLNLKEVDKIVGIPVKALLSEACAQECNEEVNGKIIVSYIYTWNGIKITGATARILKQFLGIVTEIIS